MSGSYETISSIFLGVGGESVDLQGIRIAQQSPVSLAIQYIVREGRAMWIGWNEFDVLLGDVHSLKAKRSVVRPVLADIRKRFQISVAEVEDAELYRRTRIGVSMVSSDRSHVEETLQRVEELVARLPEVELLASKMRLVQSTDF